MEKFPIFVEGEIIKGFGRGSKELGKIKKNLYTGDCD